MKCLLRPVSRDEENDKYCGGDFCHTRHSRRIEISGSPIPNALQGRKMEGLNSAFGLSGAKNQKKEVLVEKIKREIAMANATQLLEKINSNCFEKCVAKIGYRLDSADETCLYNCADKYMNSYNIVSRALVARLHKESQVGASLTVNSQSS